MPGFCRTLLVGMLCILMTAKRRNVIQRPAAQTASAFGGLPGASGHNQKTWVSSRAWRASGLKYLDLDFRSTQNSGLWPKIEGAYVRTQSCSDLGACMWAGLHLRSFLLETLSFHAG